MPMLLPRLCPAESLLHRSSSYYELPTYLLATIANRIIVFSFFKPFLDLVEVSKNVSK